MFKIFKTPVEEAAFIADEIKRIMAQSSGLFDYGDFAILSRHFIGFHKRCLYYSYLTTVRDNYSHLSIKRSLEGAGIPVRILVKAEPPSFDCPATKEILAYIRLSINSAHIPSLIRVMEGRLGRLEVRR